MILKNLLNQFIRFGAVGCFGTAAHYIVLISLVQIIRADAIIGSISGFRVGAIVNYFLNYRFTFHSRKRHRETFLRFFSVAFVGLWLNTFIMAVLIKLFGVNYLFAQVLTTGTVLICTFTGNRFWTFHERNVGCLNNKQRKEGG